MSSSAWDSKMWNLYCSTQSLFWCGGLGFKYWFEPSEGQKFKRFDIQINLIFVQISFWFRLKLKGNPDDQKTT